MLAARACPLVPKLAPVLVRELARLSWDRLAEIYAQYLGKGQLVAVEGRLQTRQWEDDKKLRHWKTEIVAGS